ncbi:unnamed protein product [Calicophoron daubneyi]|uniref:Uncharacterized protein n=1 Tax=Calicophoron daubneyi TaxID=300641 RepID=A0AAV2T5G7_CALDB
MFSDSLSSLNFQWLKIVCSSLEDGALNFNTGSVPAMDHNTKKGKKPVGFSLKERLAPADLLLSSSLAVGIPGLALVVVGIVLANIRDGNAAHYSLTFVGLGLLIAGTITGSIALRRITVTNRRLDQMGMTASEFMTQWNNCGVSLPRAGENGNLNSTNRWFDSNLHYTLPTR